MLLILIIGEIDYNLVNEVQQWTLVVQFPTATLMRSYTCIINIDKLTNNKPNPGKRVK